VALNLFAGIPVSDFAAAKQRYEQLLGGEPTFMAHETEGVWELAPERWIFVVEEPARAGGATQTILVDDLDAQVTRIAARGVEPDERVAYGNGARKAIYRDDDGNELSFGEAPTQ
jgi:hypothetical protein